MRQLLRIALCILSILALTTTITQANEQIQLSQQQGQSQQQQTVDLHPETIQKHYVQIEIPNFNPMKLEPQALINEMAQVIPTVKAFSLLNWKSLSRDEFQVESYQRVHHFGKWVNDKRDKSCQNTRAKVLVRDSTKPVIFRSQNKCTVESGEWNDPFSNNVLTDAIAEVQVDHLVPLKNAYIMGAHKWDYRTRCLYANYLGSDYHLKGIAGDENNLKSDNTPVKYLPTNPEYRCTFLKNWLLVKTAWNLEMSPREASAIKKTMEEENCNPKQFQITVGEINEHRRFVKANLDLCPAVPEEEFKN